MTKVELLKADLNAANRLLKHGYERRSTIPVLSHIKVDTDTKKDHATLTITDLDVQIEVRLPVTGRTHKDTFLIDFATWRNITQATTSSLGFERETGKDVTDFDAGEGISIKVNRHIPPIDFPVMGPFAEQTASFTATQDQMKRLLGLARWSISEEATRYYLNGLHLCQKPGGTTLRGVSTDGHRMSVVDTDIPFPPLEDVIVPKKVVDLILDMCRSGGNEPIEVKLFEGSMESKATDVQIRAKLIDGTFPDYTRVVPKIPNPAPIRATVSANAIKRIVGFATERQPAVAFDLSSGKMTMKSISRESEISLPFIGDFAGDTAPEPYGFNVRYLHDLTKTIGDFSFQSIGTGDPFLARGEDPDAFFIVMPMRLG